MARAYWLKWRGGGCHLEQGATAAQAKREGARLANTYGVAVTVGYDEIPRSRMQLRRNPDVGNYIDAWRGKLAAEADRAKASLARKPRRMTKHDRRSAPIGAKAVSSGGKKFLVEAFSGKSPRPAYQLTRGSKAAAVALAEEFAASGYRATVREI